jgi:hypothetical protein
MTCGTEKPLPSGRGSVTPIVLAAGGWFGTWLIERADRQTGTPAE